MERQVIRINKYISIEKVAVEMKEEFGFGRKHETDDSAFHRH